MMVTVNFFCDEMESLTLSAVKIFKVVSGRQRLVLTVFLQTRYGLVIIFGHLSKVLIVQFRKHAVFLNIKGTHRLRNIDFVRGSSRGINISIIRSLD